MPNQISRRTLLAALVAAGPLRRPGPGRRRSGRARDTASAAPAPMTGPQVALPPTDLKAPYPEAGKVNRLDPRLDVLIDADAKVEKDLRRLPACRRAGLGWRQQRLPAGLRHPGQPHRQMVAYRGPFGLAGAFGL